MNWYVTKSTLSVGRVVFELFADSVPKTAENFRYVVIVLWMIIYDEEEEEEE